MAKTIQKHEEINLHMKKSTFFGWLTFLVLALLLWSNISFIYNDILALTFWNTIRFLGLILMMVLPIFIGLVVCFQFDDEDDG